MNRLSLFRRLTPSLVLVSFFVVPWPAARAQEVNWRGDYHTARREASEQNRPILIDFGTENCFWCKKLDASTFRDPSVASVLNDRFVPLRIDATRDAPLAEALRVQSYPTIVLASADGKILDVQEGFVEAPQLLQKLNKALGSGTDPEWMVRDYEGAGKAIAASDYGRAVALLKNILDDGQQRPVQVKAKQLLQDLEQQAPGRIARANPLA